MEQSRSTERRGVAGSTEKHDIRIEIECTAPSATAGGRDDNKIDLSSPVASLFGAYQRAAITTVLDEAGLVGVAVRATDNHALDFVIHARVRAAIARFRSIADETDTA